MIYDLYIYVAPTLIVLCVFWLLNYRDLRKRKLAHAQTDMVFAVWDLIIKAKAGGHIEGDLPSYEEIETLIASSGNPSAKPNLDDFAEAVRVSKRISSHEDLVGPFRKMARCAVRLGLIKSPGRSVLSFAFFVLAVLAISGVSSLVKLTEEKKRVLVGDVMSRVPVRFC